MKALVVCAGLALASGCTEKNPLFCKADTDCADPTRPFCDADAEFQPAHNLCIAQPANCPIERCGCTPGESIACDVDQHTVCAADGMSTATETCALGCSTENRCLTFEPSNGLGPALEMAASSADVSLSSGATIDTDLGVVKDANGVAITIPTLTVDQTGLAPIRVFVAHSWTIDAITIRGGNPVALVAATEMTITGAIDASADGIVGGPGSQEAPAACAGITTQEDPPNCFPACHAEGAGGAGNATAGGAGGAFNTPGKSGGAAVGVFTPLTAGCRGGSLRDSLGAPLTTGGAGGGAIQIVSGNSIRFTSSGLVDLAGGGGQSSSGGGSGGTLVLEAPNVAFEGSATGVFANGGAGGGCNSAGADGRRSALVALAPKCSPSSAGNGGTATTSAEPGEEKCPGGACSLLEDQGGGGASVGRLSVATKSGDFEMTGTPVVSAVITRRTLTLK